MKALGIDVKTGFVATEGDELFYEVRGQGLPLLMIPGGGGDGRMYSSVAELLSDRYKVITYDRRANARSTGNDPLNFDICQQSRDAVAVLHATGEASGFIFGNSSGAVIALDIAKTQPQAVRAIAAHEPPITRVHPHAEKWRRFFASVYSTSFRLGTLTAMLQFVFGVGLPIRQIIRSSKNRETELETSREVHMRPENISDYFVKQELLPVTNYMPDLDMIKKGGVKVFMAAGKESLKKKRFYAETAPVLASMLNCEMIIFPGHHVSYLDMPNEWSGALHNILQQVK
jgi:pimeloyl-ACP methyl ester carboxylesterase